MKIIRLFLIICTLGMWFTAAVHADSSATYSSLADLGSLFTDPNTGLTVFPTLLIPMGGRLEGMGTAFTAVADDAGFLEANPAGSALLEKNQFSIFHHSWIADSNLEGLVYAFRIGNLGLGFGGKFLYIPFTVYNEWGESGAQGLISETVGTANISYNLFPAYEFDGLSLGLNLKAAYRHIPAEIYPGQSAFTGLVDVGMLTRFNLLKYFASREKNCSVGLVLKNLGLPALGEPLPLVLATGVAYAPLRPLLVSVDFNLPLSLNPADQPAERWYLATGVEITVTDFLSFQTGLQLKENPRLSFGSTIETKYVSFVANYNLDLSGSINPLDKFSIEAKISLGDDGRYTTQRKVEELYANGLEAFAKGDYDQAIAEWKKSLIINPNFTPAKEGIETAEKRLELQKEMEKRQQLKE